MKADSVGAPVTKKQWDYIHDTGIALRASLDNVTAVFAPSCIGHSVLSKRDWLSIKIDDISLPEALRCWESSTETNNKELSRRASDGKKQHNHRKGKGNKNIHQKRKNKKNQKQEQIQERHRLSKERRQQQRRKNGLGRKMRNQGKNSNPQDGIKSPRLERSHIAKELKSGRSVSNNVNHKNGKKRKNQLHNNRNNNIHKRRMNEHTNGQQTITEPTRCSLRLLERCSWPQCNHSCPSITNPLTGKEMRFLELLASFGLDIEAVATALGINMTTLSNMDRTELLNLLTQTS